MPRPAALVALCCLTACRVGIDGAPALEPRTAPEWAQAAEHELDDGQVETARGLLAEGLARYPGDPRLRWTQASLLALWGDAGGACEALRAILAGPVPMGLSVAEVQGFLGDVLFDAGRFGEAAAPLLAAGHSVEGRRRGSLALLTTALPPVGGAVFAETPQPRDLYRRLLPQVAVRIAGRELVLVLDTGSSWTALSASAAQRVGMDPPQLQGTARDGRGLPFAVGLAVAPMVVVGGVDLGDRPVAVVEDARLLLRDPLEGGGERFDGLLGMDLLRPLRLELDGRQSQVLFLPPQPAPVGARCLHDAGRLVCRVEVEEQPLWFLLDTGASRSSLTTAGLQRLPGGPARADAAVRRIRSPAGADVAVRDLTVRSLQVGGLHLHNLTLPILARDPAGRIPLHGVLGADVLLRGRLVLDRGVLEIAE